MPDAHDREERLHEVTADNFDLAEFRADVVGFDGHVLVNVAGELDLASASQLDGVLDRVTATNPSSVVLDLAGLSFADSTGLCVLAKWQRLADEDGFRLVVHSPPRNVRRVLDLSGLVSVLHLE